MSLLDDQNMPHVCRIRRARYAVGRYGGDEVDFYDFKTGVSCWMQNATANEIRDFDKRNQRITHRVFFNEDPGLKIGDEIEITSGESFVGVRVKHQASTDRSAGFGVLFRSMAEEETNEYENVHN